MKILIATFSFPPEVGGVAEVARTHAVGLAARGHEVTVATSFHAQRTAGNTPDGITVKQFKIHGSCLMGDNYRGDIKEYQDFLRNADADVLMVHCWQTWATDVAFPVLSESRAKKVLISHGFDLHIRQPSNTAARGWGVWLRGQPYVRRLPSRMKLFDRLVFLSAREDSGRFHDVSVANRTCPERVAVIPNGVHLAEFRHDHGDFRKTHGIETKYLFLNVANYCDRKNQLATLRDFMAANRKDATLAFIGGVFNEYQREMLQTEEQLRHRFPEAKVRYFEKIPKRQIYAAYQAADVFLLGAKFETQPLAILDAMAAGIPFISTPTGCVSEFPGGITAGTGGETTLAIERLVNDEALRRKLGGEGRAACEMTYDWGRVLDAYEKLLTDLIRPN